MTLIYVISVLEDGVAVRATAPASAAPRGDFHVMPLRTGPFGGRDREPEMAVQLTAPYTTTAFPPGAVPHSGMLELTDDDLAHAMFAAVCARAILGVTG